MIKTPVIDVHQHMGPWPFPGRWGGIQENLGLMALRGIDRAIISSALAVVQDMSGGNAELLESIAEHPQLYAYITVNPTMPQESVAELRRYERAPRVVGAKVHTHYSGCTMDDPRLAAMLATLQEWGRPLLLHTWGTGEVAHLRNLATRLPRLQIVVAHAGGDAWREAIAAAQACPNLYLDFACSTPFRGAIERALALLGPQRVLFGTDATLFDPLVMKSRYDALSVDAADRALIMGSNTEKLFQL
jgi:predicted TIM-barrel fold metal-dependent hydrolase